MAFSKERFKEKFVENVRIMTRKPVEAASHEQLYEALAFTVRDLLTDKWIATHDAYLEEDPKIVYYLSMEFLMGRFLGNALINLGVKDEVKALFSEMGLDYDAIEDAERDPGLGNGGLGRLAACFLDSLSTHNLPAYGAGLRYRYGIFEQAIENGFQVEKPDHWLERGDFWGVKRKEYAVEVKFGGTVRANRNADGSYTFVQEDAQSVRAMPYDYPVPGYDSDTVNTLRLWESEAINQFDLGYFNQGEYIKAVQEQNLANTLSKVLYPADDTVAGKELRLRQQYFFISATLQTIITRFKEKHGDFELLPDKVALQLNDTHPSVAVPELMRILMDENGLSWDVAWDITRRTCAYTNHTIMSEALEKWPTELFSRVLPRIYMIIEEINRRFCAQLVAWFGHNPEKVRDMAIIADGYVRMAYLAIAGSFSVNGVAAIHSNILKTRVLKDFYEIYPEKFNNKTNGITPRRWLKYCNPDLAKLVTETIGDGWAKDLSQLERLLPYAEDKGFADEFMRIKRANKAALADYIKKTSGHIVDPDSIFDIQIKRLHEYKRQLMNILYVMSMYKKLKEQPWLEFPPRTFIFGAKAAASYRRAKLIIKLINSVAAVVNADPAMAGRMKVIFVPNYKVSLAERLIPAADVSQQISTAGTEASGTGNMKFMLNGAVTLGTMDGANVEIFEEVGEDNIVIFGMSVQEVAELKASGSYNPWDLYNMNPDIQSTMNMLINGSLSDDHDLFRELYESLLNGIGHTPADEYFVLQDFASYAAAQEEIGTLYKNPDLWAKIAINNVAKSGKFSSDRTILQYADEIWNLKKAPVKVRR
ncbi:MAG: glycogen/starch/alpha-glucan phosphorylase [Clostridiales bacterium]|jgi:starch phosphorylase|nr:glycogen/starch/alpha-glucan phosphorylase [Clostridiales bacterium]